jgi:hypothetical protein
MATGHSRAASHYGMLVPFGKTGIAHARLPYTNRKRRKETKGKKGSLESARAL